MSKLKRLLRELSDICANIYIEEYEDDYNGKTYSEEDLKYKFTKLTKEDTKKMSSTEYFYIIDNNRFKKVDYSYIYADGNENAEASRRVEVKFRLKDEEMIEELRGILDTSE